MNTNKNNNYSFELAEIEIVNIVNDVIITSWKPFPGEDDEFETYYWDEN